MRLVMAQLATTLELDELRKEHGDATIDELTDQFITRRLGPTSTSLSTELVIRLCNEFPTTEREVRSSLTRAHRSSPKLTRAAWSSRGLTLGALVVPVASQVREFERRTRMHEEKLDEVVDGMLGSSLGKSLSEAEREQMKNMMREQSAAASAAQVQAEQTAEGRREARVTFKKGEGNAAFKAVLVPTRSDHLPTCWQPPPAMPSHVAWPNARPIWQGEFQQAAVFYTEALTLDSTQHALFSNRAACFLKLGRCARGAQHAAHV